MQALGEPGAAGADADEPGGIGDAGAELARELLAKRFSVREMCLCSRPPRPFSRRLSRAEAEESRSSESTTGSRNRTSSCRAKRRARSVISCSPPSDASGRPTSSRSGRHSLTRVATSAMRRPPLSASNVPRGLAIRVSVSPTATPTQRVPKSKASMVWPETFDGATAASLTRVLPPRRAWRSRPRAASSRRAGALRRACRR